MISDFRYAIRQVRKSPGFSAVAIVTLGLGIGVTTATFSWVRAILFARLPVDAPARIVMVWSTRPTGGVDRTATSAADYLEWRATSSEFEELAAAAPVRYNLAGLDAPVRASALRATPEVFSILGISAAVGRLAGHGDERVAVLSHQLWTSRFGQDRGVVGRPILLDGEPYTIIGVASQSAAFWRADLWTPLAVQRGTADRSRRDLLVFGRLKEDRTIDAARAELSGIATRLERDYPDTNAGWTVSLVPLHEALLGSDTTVFLGVFTAAAVIVLLIGCANIANLLIARGLGRRHEVAVRLALGAGRGRVVRQLLTESVVLGACGCALGLLIAVWLNDLLRTTALGSLAFVEQPRLDAAVLLFASTASLAAALMFGAVPALQSSALRPQDALKAGALTSTRSSRASLRHVLIAGEVALATALLIVAGVFIRTGVVVLQGNPGFDAANVLTARISLPPSSYAALERAAAFYEQAIADLSARTGIIDAAATTRLPLAGGAANPNRTVDVEGRPATGADRPWAIDLVITPAYFRALRIPIVSGRPFSDGDRTGALPVAIVSHTFASHYLAAADAAGTVNTIGRRIRLGTASQWLEIIGVAADVRNDDLGAPPAPQVYVPHAQNPAREMSLLIRTAGPPASMQGAIESVVQALDPTLPLYDVRTMEQVVAADIPDVPVIMGIFGVCSMLALLLASLGIYGVVAYSVRQQTREIAIRVALGARPREVISVAVSRTAMWSATGLVAGLAAAVAVSRMLAHALDFIEGIDAMMLSGTLVGLMLVTILASYLPVRQAVRIDPITALRTE